MDSGAGCGERRAADALCWHRRQELPAESSPWRLQPGFSFDNFALLLLVMPRRKGSSQLASPSLPRRLLSPCGHEKCSVRAMPPLCLL